MEIPSKDLDRPLFKVDGDVGTVGGKHYTPRQAFMDAANLITPNLTPDTARAAASLVQRIHDANGSLRLESEDISLLKNNACRCVAPSIFVQLYDILEPPVQEEGEPS